MDSASISQQYEIITEKAIKKIASKGINGVIFLIALEKTDLSDASLAAVLISILGGPFTFFPTVALVAATTSIKTAIKYRGFDEVLERVLTKLEAQGIQPGDIAIQAEKYPLPKSLKVKVEETLKDRLRKDLAPEED